MNNVIFISLVLVFVSVFPQVVKAQEHLLDNGVEWDSDPWITLPTLGTVIDSPYVYMLSGYGLLLSEISFEGDSLNYLPLDTLKGFTQCESSFAYFNDIVIWGQDVLYIAQRVGNSLEMRSRTHMPHHMQFWYINEDSILVHREGFIDLHDLSNPQFLWNSSQDLTITRKSFLKDSFFINHEWNTSIIEIWDATDRSSPELLNTYNSNNLRSAICQPIFINNKIFFITSSAFTVITINENNNIVSVEDYEYDEVIPNNDFIAFGAGIVQDSLIYLFNHAEYQNQDHSIALLNPFLVEGSYFVDFRILDILMPSSGNVTVGGIEYFSSFDSFIVISHEKIGSRYVIDIRNINEIGMTNSTNIREGEVPSIYKLFDNSLAYVKDKRSPSIEWFVSEITNEIPDSLFAFPENVSLGYDTDINENFVALDRTFLAASQIEAGELYYYDAPADTLILQFDLPAAQGYEILPLSPDIKLLSVAHQDSLQFYQIGTDSLSHLSSLSFSDRSMVIQYFTGNELLVNRSSKLYSIIIDEEGNYEIVDSLELVSMHQEQQLIYDEPILATYNELIQIEDNHSLTRLYNYYSPGFLGNITGLNDNKVAVSWMGRDFFWTTSIFDITDSYIDTIANIRRTTGIERTLIYGDTIWCGNQYRLSRYILTHDFNGVDDVAWFSELPLDFQLLSPYPNPFNSYVKIPFQMNRAGSASVAIYDILGREITRFANKRYSAGNHYLLWQGISQSEYPVASGTYFISLESENSSSIRKIILIK